LLKDEPIFLTIDMYKILMTVLNVKTRRVESPEEGAKGGFAAPELPIIIYIKAMANKGLDA